MPKRGAAEMQPCNHHAKRGRKSLARKSPLHLNVHSSHYIINGPASFHASKSMDTLVPSTQAHLPLQKISDDTYDLLNDVSHARSMCISGNHFLPLEHYKASQNLLSTSKPSKGRLVRKPTNRSLSPITDAADSGFFSSVSMNPRAYISVTGSQLSRFLDLLEVPIIRKFMDYDICLRVTDKYLMAMAFAYFARGKLAPNEYNTMNLFVALYLAHDMEEDEEDYKYEIFPWALGKIWRSRYKVLLNMRDSLWKRMAYRAVVSRKCCEEIMSIEPEHPVWQRVRKEHHGGAVRHWLKDKHDDGRLIGPDGSPRHCKLCNYPAKSADSDHDSLSPENDQIWLQMDSSSSSLDEFTPTNITNSSINNTGFNMNDLQHTLLCSSNRTNSSGKGRSLASGDTTLDWVDCFSDIESPYRRPEI